jgi:hypothetical protein
MTMKKLKLDELAVETFETLKPVDRRGTVLGQADSSAGPYDCGFGCTPTDRCYTDACTDDPCGTTTPGATMEYSCNCLSNEWACPDTEACPEVTSFGETC